MREIRLYGSEGGVALTPPSLPLSTQPYTSGYSGKVSPNSELTLWQRTRCRCGAAQDRLKAASDLYKQARLVSDPEVLFKDTDLDAIAIATPVSTHFALAKRALGLGKDVWLEKPMTEKVKQAEELIERADKTRKILHVDHTFVYTGAVRKIKELIDKNELGDLIYYDSTRVNRGLFQQDVDVIWDLAPHDISIMDYLMPFKKQAVSATGSKYYGNGIVPKALLTIYMENNVVGHINVSWVSPVKIRQTLIGGCDSCRLRSRTGIAR